MRCLPNRHPYLQVFELTAQWKDRGCSEREYIFPLGVFVSKFYCWATGNQFQLKFQSHKDPAHPHCVFTFWLIGAFLSLRLGVARLKLRSPKWEKPKDNDNCNSASVERRPNQNSSRQSFLCDLAKKQQGQGTANTLLSLTLCLLQPSSIHLCQPLKVSFIARIWR